MPFESNQTALSARALKRLARIFDYSRQESEAEDNWETLNPTCLKLNLVKVRASLRCLASCRKLLIQLNRRR